MYAFIVYIFLLYNQFFQNFIAPDSNEVSKKISLSIILKAAEATLWSYLIVTISLNVMRFHNFIEDRDKDAKISLSGLNFKDDINP